MPKGVYPRPPVKDRFYAKVVKSEECWEWVGSYSGDRKKGRRGQFYLDGRLQYVARVSWQFEIGSIPDGMIVCHKCDNPKCVNPSHLFLGTYSDNMRDMVDKDRQSKKLTVEEVKEIREKYNKNICNQAVLAEKFNVDQSTISRICSKELRKHVN